MEVEMDSTDAVVVLHCMVQMGHYDKKLYSRVVDLIEARYYSMELAWRHHPLFDMFPHGTSFQSLVHGLPLNHKVKLILKDSVERASWEKKERAPRPEPDPKKAWKTMDPVDMEQWERERYEKGRIRVQRIRDVKAKVTKMPPGRRLRSTLALELMQDFPSVPLGTLAECAQIFAFSTHGPLTGDLLEDAQEALAARVAATDRTDLRPYALAFASGMGSFSGPQAFRAWRTRLLPAVAEIAASERALDYLDQQVAFHPLLRGVPHDLWALPPPWRPPRPRRKLPADSARAQGEIEAKAEPAEDLKENEGGTEGENLGSALGEAADEEEIRLKAEAASKAEEARKAQLKFEAEDPRKKAVEAARLQALEAIDPLRRNALRADRAAQLLIAVASARQVEMSVELFDHFAGMLVSSIAQWREAVRRGGLESPPPVLPLETLADALDACVRCGISGGPLPQLLTDLLAEGFRADVLDGRFELSEYSVADLAAIAHASALLCEDARETLDLVWAAASPKLRRAEPHLALMLLNAVVRGGSDELLTSKPLLDAVDELLVQRFDFDTALLGKLGR